jgi:hypothetical protein
MISFLNSGIFVALIAVAIPLLIHLINRRKQIRIKFSTVRFLKSIEEKRIKKIKLYQILLILIRTLLILCLVLAFARPTVMNSLNVSQTTAHSTVVIILDNGINMQGYDKAGNRFLRAREKGRLIRAQYRDTDRILIFSSQNPENILMDSVSIQALSCSYTSADWRYSIETARRFFISNPNINQDLFILSDFQFNDPFFSDALKSVEPARTHLVQIRDGKSANVSIDSMVIRNKIFEIGKPVQMDVSVHNSSGTRWDDMEIHLFLNDQRAAYQKVSLDPLENRVIPLSFLLRNNQRLQGYVEISDDDLLADNRYYFAVPVPDQLKVLFVENETYPYFDAALNTIDLHTNLKITREKYMSWARQPFDDFQILFLSNPSMVSPVLIQRLATYLDQGGCLFLMPGDKNEIPAFNQICQNLDFSIRLTSIREVAQREEFFTLNNENWNQPLFKDIFRNTAGDLSHPQFYKYFQVQTGGGYEEILTFNTHDPFILRSFRESGSVYLITSRMEDAWTDLHYKGIFLPLMVRLFLLGATNSSRLSQSMNISHHMTMYLKPPKNYRDFFILSSDGNKNKIINQARGSGITIDLETISNPGIYTLLADMEELMAIPVNADTRSLRPPFINPDNLSGKTNHLHLVTEKEDLAEMIHGQRTGIELGKLFFLLAVTVLFLELWLVKKTEGQKVT